MKKTILFLAILFLPATGFGQNLPSWAEPSEDRSFGEHPTEKRAPDVSQREGLSGLSGEYDTDPFNRNPQTNTFGCLKELGDGRDWCECKRNSGGFLFHKVERWCDKKYPPSKPIPIDNPFAIGFLVALGFVYAYIKL